MANSNTTPSGVSATKDNDAPAEEKTGARKTAPKKASRRVNNVDSVRSPVTAALESKSGDDPNYEERLVRNDPIRLEQLQDMGYEVVTNDKGEKDVIRDLVRMRIPKELYEERRADQEARTREMTAMPGSRFQQSARQAGAQATDQTRIRRGTMAAADND